MSSLIAILLLSFAADPSATVAGPPEARWTATETAVDTLVVCPDSFRAALRPWCELRRGEGHHIAIISNLASPDEIRWQIRQEAQEGHLRFVVLIGTASMTMYERAAVRDRGIPMHYAQARVNSKWGSTPTIASDNWYAQPETADDEHPEPAVAIGRIPAESPEELSAIVKKIVDYERSSDFGPWRRQMNFVAGVGDFGLLADTLIESAATLFMTQTIPAEYRVSMTYGNWRSPYCPDPRRFHATALERLDEGALLWVYMGHGSVQETDPMETPRQSYPILTLRDATALRGTSRRPIALFLSCYAGAVDARGGCLATALLRAPGGPVAVIAGSRMTMPYALTLLSTNLTDELFRSPCATLGEALLHAKRRMLREPEKSDSRRATLDAIAGVVSPSAQDLAAERAEHVLMFHLIGDPLLRLRHPQPAVLKTAPTAPAGQRLVVQGTSPIEGQATLELVVRRDRIRGPRPTRDAYPRNDAALLAYDEVYQRANDRRLSMVPLAVRKGPFRAEIDIPVEAAGACQVCIFVSGRDDMAAGSVDVKVTDAATAERQTR